MARRAAPDVEPGKERPSVVYRPLSAWWLWLALLVVALIAPAVIGLTTLGARQVRLFHAMLYDSCHLHAYTLHWQAPGRYPRDLTYNFAGRPVSFVLVEIWLNAGPALRVSRNLPLQCAARP